MEQVKNSLITLKVDLTGSFNTINTYQIRVALIAFCTHVSVVVRSNLYTWEARYLFRQEYNKAFSNYRLVCNKTNTSVNSETKQALLLSIDFLLELFDNPLMKL